MKKKIPTDILIEIEAQQTISNVTGVFSLSTITRLIEQHSCNQEMVAEAMQLAETMPFEEIQEAIATYDSSSPKMDELQFIKDLMIKYKVSRGDVIKRIQYVRRIIKRMKEEENNAN